MWVVAALSVLLSSCGQVLAPTRSVGDGAAAATTVELAPDVPPGDPVEDAEAIQAVLDRAAEAFRSGDPEALRPLLHDPANTFGRRWLDRLAHVRDVPLSTYRLDLDETFPDLATARVRDVYDGDVQVVYVVEELAITGYDEEPAHEDLFLTVVRQEGESAWTIASDRHAESLGLVSVDHLWDHGPVVTTSDGPILALHHPGTDVGALLTEARRALTEASDRWPLAWPERVPIIIPADEAELAELLHVTFDLSNFIAFATATPVTELDEYRLTAPRVVLNPTRFLARSSATRQLILVHELVHVATRPVAGPMMPSWLEEGVAQALGERRSTTGTRLIDAMGTSGLELPTDSQFTVGGRDRIFLSYQQAWSFLDHLRDVHGDDAVARFYAEVGARSREPVGTERRRVDDAAMAVFGRTLDGLKAEWRGQPA